MPWVDSVRRRLPSCSTSGVPERPRPGMFWNVTPGVPPPLCAGELVNDVSDPGNAKPWIGAELSGLAGNATLSCGDDASAAASSAV